MPSPIAHNRHVWNERVRRGLNHTSPAERAWFEKVARLADVHGWLPHPLTGLQVLCLAAGGGRHGPIYAAAGAHVTVVDISPEMLRLDQEVAAHQGLQIQTVETSMDDLRNLGVARFDVVIQPVSTCYVPDPGKVFAAVAAVTKPGGLYVSQHKQPASLQTQSSPSHGGYLLTEPYEQTDPLPVVQADQGHREAGCLEFLHTWETLIGGLCRAGFVLEDLVEPRHGDGAAPKGSFAHRCLFLPPFVALKARRLTGEAPARPVLWTP